LDLYSWVKHLEKFDANSIVMAYVPLTLRHRQYTLRYSPAATTTKKTKTYVSFSPFVKNSQRTTVYESGTNKPASQSSEIKSGGPVTELNGPVSERIFKDIDGGSGWVAAAGFEAHMEDGSYQQVNATVAIAQDDWYTKDFRDVRVERSSVDAGKNKRVDYVVCGTTSRNWNNAPVFGFSQDVLYMTEDSRYGFGKTCEESKFNFKAKVYRNETAAAFARNTAVGRS